MSTTQKRIAFSALAITGLVVMAGITGPSASSVAHAEAQGIVGKAFSRLANLTPEERAALEKKFQEEGIQFKKAGKFISMKDLTPEEKQKMQEKMKTTLADALLEAQSAADLTVVSADQMPIPGFIGNAGRTFGFKMMHDQKDLEDKLANLPEDVRKHIQERPIISEEMKPVSFLVYTNKEGEKVHLGMNAKNEPVVILKQFKGGNGAVGGPSKMMFFDKKIGE